MDPGRYAILAEKGIKAPKIDRLCHRLSVTRGSLYWHFTDMAGALTLGMKLSRTAMV